MEEWRKEGVEQNGLGYFLKFPVDAARIVGSVEVCGKIMGMSYVDLLTEIEHAEHERAEALRASGLGETI